MFSRVLLVEADKLIPSHTGGGTEFSRGYDQAMVSLSDRLRRHAQDVLPPSPSPSSAARQPSLSLGNLR